MLPRNLEPDLSFILHVLKHSFDVMYHLDKNCDEKNIEHHNFFVKPIEN